MHKTKRIVSLGTAAMVLASLISPNLHSQESPIPHPPSGNVDWRFENKPPIAGQLVRFLMEDRDDDDDRHEKSRDNHRAKKDKKSQKSRKSQPEHREQAHAAPVHSEVLELLRNINRTLKSMETMMREDMEQDRKRPEQAFQHMVPPMPPKFGPQNFNHSFGPEMRMPSPPNNRGLQPQNQNNRGPRSFGPRNDGPRNDGPRNDGPRNDGPRNDGPRNDGPRNDGPRSDGLRNEGPRNEGPRNEGPRNEGPRSEGPRSEGPRSEGPRGDGPRGDGPRGDGPRGDGPRGDGPRGDGPRSEGLEQTGREEMGNECKVHQRQEPLSGNSFRINGFTGQGMKCQETKSPKMTDLELRGEETMQQKVPNSSMAIAKPSFR